MKTIFVLSGGGSKGPFQAGVLKSLLRRGIYPSLCCGTSVGGLNAAASAHCDMVTIEGTWRAIKGRGDVLSLNWWKLLFATGLYSMAPLRRIIESITQGTPKHEAVVCYVNQQTGEIGYASNMDMPVEEFRQFVEASASIPMAMEPVEKLMPVTKDGLTTMEMHDLVDGGVREQTPLKYAIKRGADRIVVILCNPLKENPDAWPGASFPKIISHGFRASDIMQHETFVNDIKVCLRRNTEPGYRKIDLTVIAPKEMLHDTLDFSPELLSRAFELGVRAGDEVIIE